MTTEDQEIFYFDVRKINWQNYFENYILGVRKLIFKDDPVTLPLARSNLKRYTQFLLRDNARLEIYFIHPKFYQFQIVHGATGFIARFVNDSYFHFKQLFFVFLSYWSRGFFSVYRVLFFLNYDF
jgi:hypothetical protein